MSIHRVTIRQREWGEACSAAGLAGLICCSILASTVFSQSPATPQPATTAEDLEQAPEEQEYTGPPATHLLGMSIVEAEAQGALVTKVDPRGPAAQSGVKKGDVLLSVAGHKTKPYDEFLTLLRDSIEERKKGDSVPIALLRDGESTQITLTERVGSEERKDDVQKLAEEYKEEKQQEAGSDAEGGPGAAGMLEAIKQSRSESGDDSASESDSVSVGDLLAESANTRNAVAGDNDYDYYFGSGGAYGGALTSAQQNEYDRLMRIQDRNGLTSAQQQRLDELTSLEFSRFGDLNSLGSDERTELESLMARRGNGDELTSDDRARLRQLIGREYNNVDDYQSQISELEQMEQQGELNNRDQMRLDMLREMGPGANERADTRSLEALRQLAGQNLQGLTGAQRQRLQQLASQSGDISQQDLAEMQQLRMQAQSGLARGLRNEYMAAQQMMQNGQQFTPQQAARYQQLRRNLGRFSASAPRGAVPYPAALNQPQGPGQMPAGAPGGSSGSGIGLGGQGGPSSSGSGIGTSGGPGVGSAPSGGAAGGPPQ